MIALLVPSSFFQFFGFESSSPSRFTVEHSAQGGGDMEGALKYFYAGFVCFGIIVPFVGVEICRPVACPSFIYS
ncbi:hypothetical protein [Nocardiopsis metallicus]|uniref:hypothetical protein n=1 Tax=Nocardiopsis metallicus TaxID=179819 RepID=UPI0031D98070